MRSKCFCEDPAALDSKIVTVGVDFLFTAHPLPEFEGYRERYLASNLSELEPQ